MGIEVTRTTLSCRSTIGTYVMKTLDMVWIGALQHMLHGANVGPKDVICVSQKNWATF